jgi:hypothetical protein
MTDNPAVKLCPAQQAALELFFKGLPIGSIFRIWGGVGRGKTTMLKEIHHQTGDAFLGMKDFLDASSRAHPLAATAPNYGFSAQGQRWLSQDRSRLASPGGVVGQEEV